MKYSVVIILFILLPTFCLSIPINTNGQLKIKEFMVKKDYDIYTGLHFQFHTDSKKTTLNPEIGIAKVYYLKLNQYEFCFNWCLSNEIILQKNLICGFKTSPWISISNYSFGFSFIYYTDFNKGNFKIRPEIGLLYKRFRIAIGFNIPTIDNTALKSLTNADLQLSFNYSFTFYQDYLIHVKNN